MADKINIEEKDGKKSLHIQKEIRSQRKQMPAKENTNEELEEKLDREEEESREIENEEKDSQEVDAQEELNSESEAEKENSDNEDNPEDNNPEDPEDNNLEMRNRIQKSPESEPGESNENSGGPTAEEDKTSALENIQEEMEESGEKSTTKIQTGVDTAKQKIEAVSRLLNMAVQILLNPVTLVAVAVIIVFLIISSMSSVVGKNDYNIMCSSDGIGVVSISDDADDFTRLSAITAWLTSTPFEKFGGKPFTKEQAIGIIGNISQESYRGNPKAIQGDHSMTKWENTTNEDILAWGNAGGKAIGIIQWDGGRRVQLVNFAISEGTQWHDFNTQLKFFKKELDGAEGQNLINGGFNDLTKTIADYVSIFNLKFERSALSGTEEGDRPRIQYAMDFASRYTDGSGLAMNCIGGSVNTSNLIQLAIASSYTAAERNSKAYGFGYCESLENCGQDFSKEEYKLANQIAYEKTGADGINGLLASCDRFVATMLRATGVDEEFPWGATTQQAEYLESSPKWEPISCADRQPGDVLIFKKNTNVSNGHIMLYVGMVEGKDSIASASIALNRNGRTAHISSVSCRGNLFNADGVNSQGYRKVN
jgi:hypothetical protein